MRDLTSEPQAERYEVVGVKRIRLPRRCQALVINDGAVSVCKQRAIAVVELVLRERKVRVAVCRRHADEYKQE